MSGVYVCVCEPLHLSLCFNTIIIIITIIVIICKRKVVYLPNLLLANFVKSNSVCMQHLGLCKATGPPWAIVLMQQHLTGLGK